MEIRNGNRRWEWEGEGEWIKDGMWMDQGWYGNDENEGTLPTSFSHTFADIYLCLCEEATTPPDKQGWWGPMGKTERFCLPQQLIYIIIITLIITGHNMKTYNNRLIWGWELIDT